MNCPFCKSEMEFTDYYGESSISLCFPKEEFICREYSCIIPDGQFPRYSVIVDNLEKIIQQEYVLNDFYVKVYSNPDSSIIYKLVRFLLTDEVVIPRALWLNTNDMSITLATIKTISLFS